MDKPKLGQQFSTIVSTTVFKLSQQARSNVTFSQFMAFASAASTHVLVAVEEDQHHKFKLAGNWGQISPENFALFATVYCQNMLMTAITLFDTFLSDVTRFLLLVYPKSISDQQIKLHEILDLTSVAEIIDEVVARKARGISYKNYRDRIKFLENTFGIDASNLSDKIDLLEQCVELRNSIVHDVSLFRYTAGGQLRELEVAPKEDQIIDWITAEQALLVCVEIIQALSSEISRYVFDTELDDQLTTYLDRFLQTLREDIRLQEEYEQGELVQE